MTSALRTYDADTLLTIREALAEALGCLHPDHADTRIPLLPDYFSTIAQALLSLNLQAEALFAGELAAVAQQLIEHPQDGHRIKRIAVLASSSSALSRHLEKPETHHLMDAVVRLYPHYAQLRALQGAEAQHSALFMPDLHRTLASRPVNATQAQKEQYLRHHRSLFQQALLAWLRDSQPERLTAMQQVMLAIARVLSQGAGHTFCHTIAAFFDVLLQDSPLEIREAKILFSRVDSQLRHILDDAHPMNVALCRDILYRINASHAESERLSSIRGLFDLEAPTASFFEATPQGLYSQMSVLVILWQYVGPSHGELLPAFRSEWSGFQRAAEHLQLPLPEGLLSAIAAGCAEGMMPDLRAIAEALEVLDDFLVDYPNVSIEVTQKLAALPDSLRGESAQAVFDLEAPETIDHQTAHELLREIEEQVADTFQDWAYAPQLKKLTPHLTLIAQALSKEEAKTELEALTTVRHLLMRCSSASLPLPAEELDTLVEALQSLDDYFYALSVKKAAQSEEPKQEQTQEEDPPPAAPILEEASPPAVETEETSPAPAFEEEPAEVSVTPSEAVMAPPSPAVLPALDDIGMMLNALPAGCVLTSPLVHAARDLCQQTRGLDNEGLQSLAQTLETLLQVLEKNCRPLDSKTLDVLFRAHTELEELAAQVLAGETPSRHFACEEALWQLLAAQPLISTPTTPPSSFRSPNLSEAQPADRLTEPLEKEPEQEEGSAPSLTTEPEPIAAGVAHINEVLAERVEDTSEEETPPSLPEVVQIDSTPLEVSKEHEQVPLPTGVRALDEELLPVLLEEADDLLPRLLEQFRSWQMDSTLPRKPMLRILHTLKGSARMSGAMDLGTRCHELEGLLIEAHTPDECSACADLLANVMHGYQDLRLMASDLALLADEQDDAPPLNGEADPALTTLKVKSRQLNRLLERSNAAATTRQTLSDELLAMKLYSAEATQQFQADPAVLTVLSALTTRLLHIEDQVLAQRQIDLQIQQQLTRMRVVPVAVLSRRLERVMEFALEETGKQGRFILRGGKVEADRSVLDRAAMALEHLIRNAVCHGLESPSGRKIAAKEEYGQISLDAWRDGDHLMLVLKDDGAGLDLEKIRIKGMALGLIPPGETVSDQALMQMIFESGLSTSDNLTELAGRGIGLDAVKNELHTLGGSIEVHSSPGLGVTFTLSLPLKLAVTEVQVVRAGSRQYALSTSLIHDEAQMPTPVLQRAYRDGVLEHGGEQWIPYYLPRLLGDTHTVAEPSQTYSILFLVHGDERLALQVDAVEPAREIVLQDMGRQLARTPGIAGATTLGGNEPLLVLHPLRLARKATGEGNILSSPWVAASKETQAPLIMVVDDSITIRKITERMLSREGYRVVMAQHGADALQKLQTLQPDAMILDIEMPQMDGFSLTRSVRNDPLLSEMPLIMITSRTSDHYRNEALSLGVNVFLTKPYQETILLSHLKQWVPIQTPLSAS